MNRIYTDEMIDYLKEISPGRFNNEITKMLNDKFNTSLTQAQVADKKSKLKIKSGVGQKGSRQLFTDEQEKYVHKNVEGKTHKELTRMVNEKFNTSYSPDQIRGLKGRRGWRSNIDARFVKGQSAWNKGLKGLHMGGKETQFKKGNVPKNYLPVGTERINTDGYPEVKIADPNVWKGKHIILWEKENGDIPEGHVIMFADGDKQNLNLNNLLLVSRGQLGVMNRNGLITNNTELTKTGLLIADIQIKRTQILKKKRGK